MKIKFSNLEQGDNIFVVYNINEHNDKYSEYLLEEIPILENKYVTRTICSGDRYSDEEYAITENFISVDFHGIHYERYYDNFYDERAQMLICPPFLNNGPQIEVFVKKKDAVKYLTEFCERQIKALNNKIEKTKEEIKLLEKSIQNIK